jgi:Right handed beta helix region
MRVGTLSVLAVLSLGILVANPAQAVSNRIFMSTNGNNASDCANPLTPCLTFAGALAQVNVGGEVIAEATGGYGPLNITQAVTISGPAGVVIYSGLQVVVNAPGATVVLRGLTIDGTGAAGNGVEVQAVGALHVENCLVQGFGGIGIHMGVPGHLDIQNTDVKSCNFGVQIDNSLGTVIASIDHCHLDGNAAGLRLQNELSGVSATTATNSTANNNSGSGWIAAAGGGVSLLNLEFCSGSGNAADGLVGGGANASSVARFSNCVFAYNGSFGVDRFIPGTLESRGNNSVTGNTGGPTSGTIGSFSPI